MHFHLPKPLHGWREFAGEVGIIVVGVLIALGAEQVVEGVHWQHEAAVRGRRSRPRLLFPQPMVGKRVALEECLRNRIADLTAKLNATNGQCTADPMKLGQARSSARLLPGIPLAYRTPARLN